MSGCLAKIRHIMDLIGDSETEIVGGEEMAEEALVVVDVDWGNAGFEDVSIEFFTPEQPWSLWGSHMQRWVPGGQYDGDYFFLKALRFCKNGIPEICITVLDENGAPLPNVAIAQGRNVADAPDLPPDSIPNGGDPKGYLNKGNVVFSGPDGIVKFGWGAPGYAPENEEGPFRYWVPMGPSGIYSDVVYGFWWRAGTQYYHVEPVFQRYVDGGVEPGTLNEIFADLFDEVAESLQYAADRLRGQA